MSFTSIRFKVPHPPDHSTFRVTNHQAEVATLVVFNADVVIPAGNRLSLLSGERSRWQHVRFRHSMYLKSKSPDAEASGAMSVCRCGVIISNRFVPYTTAGFYCPGQFSHTGHYLLCRAQTRPAHRPYSHHRRKEC